MITAKQILEEIIRYVTPPPNLFSNKGKAIVYSNPTSTDFKDLYKASNYKNARFIIDNNSKKAYVWDAELALHDYVARSLDILPLMDTLKFQGIIIGTGSMQSGKVIMTGSDCLDDMIRIFDKNDKLFLRNLVDVNWSWANNYVDITNYIHKIKACLR
jgi:hypothetical protein